MRNHTIVKKLLYSYIIIILFSVLIISIIVSKNTSKVIKSNVRQYNTITMNAISEKMASQIKNIKTSLKLIYTVKSNGQPIYNYIEDYFTNDLNTFNSEKTFVLNNYFEFVQKPISSDASIIFISSKDSPELNIRFVNSVINTNSIKYINNAISQIVSKKQTEINSEKYNALTPCETYLESNTTESYIIYDFLRNPADPSQYIGWIGMSYSTDWLDIILTKYQKRAFGTTFVITPKGQILYSSKANLYSEKIPYSELIFSSKTPSIEHVSGNMITIVPNLSAGFYVVNITPFREMYSDVYSNNFTIILVSIFAGCFSIIVALYSSHWVSKRINSITKIIKLSEPSNASPRIEISKHHDELDLIAEAYNQSVDQLSYYIDRTFVQELKLKESILKQKEQELYVLQSQINPHFLYNSLEIIRMKAVSNDSKEIASSIHTLSKLFRSRIKSAPFIWVSEELSFCNNLLLLFSMKYDGELEILNDIEENVRSFGIPKDLLQPIVENCVVHAFPSHFICDEKWIKVSACTEADDIIFIISDNGIGFTPDKLIELGHNIDHISSHTFYNSPSFLEDELKNHIGLLNVHHRIQLIYGPDYGLSVQQKPDLTQVIIRIKGLSVEALAEHQNLDKDF